MSAPLPPDAVLPDGIAPEHGNRAGGKASVFSFVVLGGLIVLGLSGLAGGTSPWIAARDVGPATLSVEIPAILRNGEFFEMVVTVEVDAPLDDAVVAIDSGLWRNITINTMVPAAAEEDFDHGAYRFHYGPLAAGDTLTMKIDGQINPRMFAGTAGEITLYDGEAAVGGLPLDITVLP